MPLDLYFRQCSISVNCRDLALMAATLANGGVNPATGKQVLGATYIERVLSVMTTCGMYNYAGEWVDDVGMPAKSGVAGGILAVLPGQLGIAVFSPPLDAKATASAGSRSAARSPTELELGLLHAPGSSRTAMRRTYTVAEVPSRRRRSAEQAELLGRGRARAASTSSTATSSSPPSRASSAASSSEGEEIDLAVVDLSEVTEIDAAAARMLVALGDLDGGGGTGAGVVAARLAARALRAGTGRSSSPTSTPRPSGARSGARRLGGAGGRPGRVEPPHALVAGLGPAQLESAGGGARAAPLPRRRNLFTAGEEADAILLIVAGEVRLEFEPEPGRTRRLATLTPGLAFGELALAGVPARALTARGESAGECLVLSLAAFERLGGTATPRSRSPSSATCSPLRRGDRADAKRGRDPFGNR